MFARPKYGPSWDKDDRMQCRKCGYLCHPGADSVWHRHRESRPQQGYSTWTLIRACFRKQTPQFRAEFLREMRVRWRMFFGGAWRDVLASVAAFRFSKKQTDQQSRDGDLPDVICMTDKYSRREFVAIKHCWQISGRMVYGYIEVGKEPIYGNAMAPLKANQGKP